MTLKQSTGWLDTNKQHQLDALRSDPELHRVVRDILLSFGDDLLKSDMFKYCPAYRGNFWNEKERKETGDASELQDASGTRQNEV